MGCDICFSNSIYSFSNEDDYNKFEKNLDSKIYSKELVFSHLLYAPNGFNRHSVYKCSECETLWHLSIPDYSWRGFFLGDNDYQLYLESKLSKGIFSKIKKGLGSLGYDFFKKER